MANKYKLGNKFGLHELGYRMKDFGERCVKMQADIEVVVEQATITVF